MKTILLILCFAASSYGFAQQLVYTPVNPAFGGDPFNYPWMLNSANAQNQFESQTTNLSDFDFLDQDGLANGFGDGFGNGVPDLGTTRDGNIEYEVFESNEGLVINILDITTGEQSQIIIPN